MIELQTLYILDGEMSPADSWRLVEWCHQAGADECSLTILTSGPEGDAFGQAFDEGFSAFQREDAPREGVMASAGEEWVRPMSLWSLTPVSIDQLRKVLPHGIFSYEIGAASTWCENLCLYRGGALMLGVVTHEGMGVVRVTGAERAELDEIGVRYRLNKSI